MTYSGIKYKKITKKKTTKLGGYRKTSYIYTVLKKQRQMKLTKKNILEKIQQKDIYEYFNCLNMTYPQLKKYYLNNF